MKRMAMWLLACLLAWQASAAMADDNDNMVANADFSTLDGQGFPEKWKTVSKGDARAAKVKGPDGAETTALEFALTGAMTRIEQILTLKADRTYRVRFQAKAREAQTAGVYLTTMRWKGGNSVVVKGTHDWQDFEFTASFPDAGTHRLILYAKEGTRGSVWFTNVSAEEVIAAEGPPARLPVGRISRPPDIDGRIGEAEWHEAVAAPPFAAIGDFRFTRFVQEATAVLAGYDDKCLYLAFRCEQACLEPMRNNLDRFKAEKKRPEEDLFSDDCVLALIQPNAPNGPVYDLVVNANGVINDAKGTGSNPWATRDSSWKSGARAAARVEDGYWTVELAIPLASVGLTSKAGREFAFMLGRINQASRERSTCFPMTAGFHNPPLFGRARLAAADAGGLADVRIGALLPGENNFAFTAARAGVPFAVVTKGETGAPLRAELKTVAGANQVAYRLPGEEYSFLQFFFGGDYVSPPYVVDTRAAEFELRTAAANPMLGEGAVRSVGDGVFRFTSHAGLFPVENIAPPYALGRAGDDARITFDGRAPEALLVGHTLFWPENRNVWSIAENSIQPLHVVLHAPHDKLAGIPYAFHLAVPAEFTLRGAARPNTSGHRLKMEEAGALRLDGAEYRHYRVDILQPPPVKSAYEATDLMTLMVELPTSGQTFATRSAAMHYWADFGDGRIVEAPGRLNVAIYPPLKGKIPEKFEFEMWGGLMVNLDDADLSLEYMRKTVRASGFSRLQNLRTPVMKTFATLNFRRVYGRESEAFLARRPEARRVDYNDNPVPLDHYNAVCVSVLLEDKEFGDLLKTALNKSHSHYDVINFDYENPADSGPLTCFCPRCRQAFAAFLGRTEVPPTRAIRETLSTEWLDFMSGRVAAVTGLFRNIAHDMGKRLTYYTGYQSDRTLRMYSTDWRKMASVIDSGSAGYYPPIEQLRATIDALGDTPFLAGVMSTPDYLTSREQFRSIPLSEMMMGIVAGAKGILVFNLPAVDGGMFHRFSQVSALLADHEDILYHGRRHQAGVRVTGLPPHAWTVFEREGTPEKVLALYNRLEIPIPDYAREPGAKALPENAPAEVTVEFDRSVEGVEHFSGAAFAGGRLTFKLEPGDAAAYVWR